MSKLGNTILQELLALRKEVKEIRSMVAVSEAAIKQVKEDVSTLKDIWADDFERELHGPTPTFGEQTNLDLTERAMKRGYTNERSRMSDNELSEGSKAIFRSQVNKARRVPHMSYDTIALRNRGLNYAQVAEEMARLGYGEHKPQYFNNHILALIRDGIVVELGGELHIADDLLRPEDMQVKPKVNDEVKCVGVASNGEA